MFSYKPSKKDLEYLEILGQIIRKTKENNLLISVLGGYGLDGLVGFLTKEHDDLDIVMYEKDIPSFINLMKGLFEETKIVTIDSRITKLFLSSLNFEIELLKFEQLSLLEKYSFSKEEIFPTEENAHIGDIGLPTPTINGHQRIGNMYEEYFFKRGIPLDSNKIKQREEIISSIKNSGLSMR